MADVRAARKGSLQGIVFFYRVVQQLQVATNLAIRNLPGTTALQFRL